MSNDQINEALRIIAYSGRLTSTPFGDLELEYNDSKIQVIALVANTNIVPHDFKRFEVFIKSMSVSSSGIATVTATKVYGVDVTGFEEDYYRPGKWEVYVTRLSRQIEESKTLLNNVPVDDSDIFPDL